MTEANPTRFAEILNTEIKALADQDGVNISIIEGEFGEQIGKKSGASIERWRTRREIPRKYQDVEKLASALRQRGRLQGALYSEFLVAGGHPNPDKLINPPPIQRPSPSEHFIGRKDELKKLSQALHPGRVVTLFGTGGVGKTALIAQVLQALAPAHKPAERFPHGIFFHDFYKQSSVDAALEQIYRTFAKDEEPRPTPQAAARRALGNKQALLVLDGAEKADDLAKVLEVRGQCGVLIVTRERAAIRGKVIDLDVLPLPEAIQVLQAWSTTDQVQTQVQVWSNEQETNQAIATEICEVVGCLPLALRLAGRYMSCPVKASDYLKQLKEMPLAGLYDDEQKPSRISILLEQTVARVKKTRAEACDVLAVIGLLSYSSFSLDVIASTLETSPTSILLSIRELINFGMIKWLSDENYQVVHRLIHTYAKHMPIPKAAFTRLATYYTQLAEEQSKLGLEGYKRLDPERAHMVAIVTGCVAHQKWTEAHRLAWNIDEYLNHRGYWLERIQINQAGLTAVRALHDLRRESGWLGRLGSVHFHLGQYKQSVEYYQQALSLAQQIGHQYYEGGWLSSLGLAYTHLGQVDTAIKYYQQALMIAREIGDRAGQGTTLGHLGNAYRRLGQVSTAIEYNQQALTIARSLSDRGGEASHLINLGLVYELLGQYEKAIDYYQRGLTISREIGDRAGEGTTLGNLGNAYVNLGQYQQGIEYYQQALTIAKAIGDRSGEASRLGNLGNAYTEQKQYEKAIDYCQQAITIARELGERHTEGDHLNNLGWVYFLLDQVDAAIVCYQQALTIAHEIGDRAGEGDRLGNLGNAYADRKQYETAIDYYQQALVIAQAISNPRNEGLILGNLGTICRHLGQVEKARLYYQQALHILEKIKSPQAESVRSWLKSLEE